jgi:predicted RNA methylase
VPAFFLLWGIIKLSREEGFFIPLPMGTIRKMLKLAKIKKGDVLYDLGSGDGRIIIEAAKNYGIRTVGIERNVLLYFLSKLNVKIRGLENRVKIFNKNFFKENIREAGIVTIYLTPKLNEKLKPKFKKELRKGTRIVSAAHEIKGWKLAKKIKTGHFWSYLYKI